MRDASTLRQPFAIAWRQLKDFSGYGGDASYLWPRWIVLRAVGLVFVIIFAGIIKESPALVGPEGLAPLPGLIQQHKDTHDGMFEAVLKVPTLFWLGTNWSLALVIQWAGMVAALALVLNLWPRVALFVCWLVLLSFARVWLVFSDPQVDWLMLEVALLCIPFAPGGFRPGLGVRSPPRRIAVFMMRWLLFRVMFESGLAKILSGEAQWANLTAMDAFYEIAPCPTIVGYHFFHLPHFWHAGEVILTFAAEIVAPLLAMFGGRRGRWIAFGLWTALQAGIQLTCNFGWLNTAAFALGFLLFDDQMLIAVARRLKLGAAALLAAKSANPIMPPWRSWQRYGLHTALWIHFYLSVIVFAETAGMTSNVVLDPVTKPLKHVFDGLGSVNSFKLYSRLDEMHVVAEFVGSNDGGVTWRPYEFRYFPQQLDRISPFIAPRFPRFEATLKIQVMTRDTPASLYGVVATHLLARNPVVMDLFEADPFPDRPPHLLRIVGYRYNFTDKATHRTTRQFWTRTYLGEFMPMIYIDERGDFALAETPYEQVLVKARFHNAAAQSYLGFLYLSGEEEAPKDTAQAAKWFRLAAEQGQVEAQFNLALLLASGAGGPADPTQAAHWCRRAAEQGFPPAQDHLGLMYAEGHGVPRDKAEALVWFRVAAFGGLPEAEAHVRQTRAQVEFREALAAEKRAAEIFARIQARK